MKNEEVENMDFGAERHTVVQNQGSRGSGAELILHQQMMKNRWKIHPKIDEKSMKKRYKKDPPTRHTISYVPEVIFRDFRYQNRSKIDQHFVFV